MQDDLTIAICNFNTTDLTNACINSVIAHIKNINYRIIVLDNSDEIPYINSTCKDVKILDNTKQQLLNFDSALAKFIWNNHAHSNNGSFKHTYSIQYLINICLTKKLLLLDSDVIVNSNLDFIDFDNIVVSDTQLHLQPIEQHTKNYNKPYISKSRFLPYIQLLNCAKLAKEKILYFDPTRIQGGCSKLADYYDTGASLYEDIQKKKLDWRKIDYTRYITHLGGQSWKKYDVNHICY